MFTVKELKAMQQQLLLLPRPTMIRILDKVQAIIDDKGFIVVGVLKRLMRDELT